jgi:lysine 2,3-aminomutase
VHASHPAELTPAFEDAVARLAAAGLPLVAQTVLLAGVNDEPETLEALFRGLYARGVRPVYLHHPDRVPGTGRFRVSIERGRALARRLRGRLPGPAIPTYVLDLPDGRGKVPVDWLEACEGPEGAGRYRVRRPDGSWSIYDDPASSSSG